MKVRIDAHTLQRLIDMCDALPYAEKVKMDEDAIEEAEALLKKAEKEFERKLGAA